MSTFASTPRARRLARYGVALAASALVLAPVLSASAAAKPLVSSANVKGFSGALVNDASKTLYALSSEKGAKIKCQGSCLSNWPPLLVKSSVTTLSLGAGVKGKIGFVTRSKTMKQVTFNSYPLYTFAGDKGTFEAHGEGINLDGGTWYLVKASANASAATLFHRSTLKLPPTTTTTTPKPTTTTTVPVGGGGAY